MGTTIYWLLAEYINEVVAKREEQRMHRVLQELVRADDFLHEIRDEDCSPEEKYKKLCKRFPIVASITTKPRDKDLDDIVGTFEISPYYCLYREGKYLFLRDEVWHFADWDGVAKLFNAKKTVWTTWEFVDMFTLLKAYLEVEMNGGRGES